MKKCFLFICLYLFAGTNVFAILISGNDNSVSVDEARQKALNFLSNQPTFVKGRNHAPQQASDLNLVHQVAMENGQNALYVFNNEAGGFVIVSGDDRAEDILGYSSEGAFDADSMPENMKGWLDEYAAQIKYVQEHGLSSSSIRKALAHPAISPMLTTMWSQYYPYNENCPESSNQEKCLTGCGATAMAQLMYYHRAKSVTETPATIPAYTSSVYVDAIPAGSHIDWDNMLDFYNYSATTEQIQAVANLMKYCGAAAKMDYSANSSKTNLSKISYALKVYFNYSYKTEQIWRVDMSSDDEWDNLIYNELCNNRPVLYSGSRNSGSHIFVCDGYDGAGYYHINWGWMGSKNGFFLLSALDPDKPYEDNAGTPTGYNRGQSVLINAAPRDNIPSHNGIIFDDAIARYQCLLNWDTNDDSDFSEEEAAAVTDLGSAFQGQQYMTSFDELRYFTGLTSICDGAFDLCCRLTSIPIPYSVKSIGNSAFSFCDALTSIDIPNGVTSIGMNAFSNCHNLTSVNIPNSVTIIDRYAFWQCSGLTSVTITNGMTSIGNEAFRGCTCLKEIYCLTEETPKVESNTFLFLDVSNVLLIVPEDAVERYKAHPVWGQFHIETPTGIKEMGDKQCTMYDDVFNLAGQRLSKPQKGLNIVNGRKVLIK